MRATAVLVGAAAIVLFGVWGALLINDWAVAAASGLPLDETVAAMERADQPYSAIAGVLFAVFGALLAIAWAYLMRSRHFALSTWAGLAFWAAIIAFGAPAYFFASFGNLNSVGDTFFDWNAGAAFALALPLYLVSGAAAVLTLVAFVLALLRFSASSRQRPEPGATPATQRTGQ